MLGLFRKRQPEPAPAVPFTDMPPEALAAAKSGIRSQLKRLNDTIDDNIVSHDRFKEAEDTAYEQAKRYGRMRSEVWQENNSLIPQRDALAATLAGWGG